MQYNYMLMRGETSNHAILGTLTVNGHYICDTLESTTCCLKAGTYPLEVVHDCDANKSKWLRVVIPELKELNPDYCEQCAEHDQQVSNCYRNFYNRLETACRDCLSQQEIELREQALIQERDLALKQLHRPVPCPKLTHGTGVQGRADGAILLGVLPPAVETLNARGEIQKVWLPILHNSKKTSDHLLRRIEKQLASGDQVTLLIRG